MTRCYLVSVRKIGKDNLEEQLVAALKKLREVLVVALNVTLLAVAVRLRLAVLNLPNTHRLLTL